MNKKQENDLIQEAINERLSRPYFIDLSLVVGVEITQMIAFVEVMQDNINKELDKVPDYLDRVHALTVKRLERDRKNANKIA